MGNLNNHSIEIDFSGESMEAKVLTEFNTTDNISNVVCYAKNKLFSVSIDCCNGYKQLGEATLLADNCYIKSLQSFD